MPKRIDRTGHVYSRLTVISRADNSRTGLARWNCVCVCGKHVVVQAGNLTSGHTMSCGCYESEVTAARNFVHGRANTRTHSSWMRMRQRCSNPKSTQFPHYGGRGIKVCERWDASFVEFLVDMGERPEGKTLDRIDPDGNYEPNNCKWSDKVEQANNKRSNVFITWGGETMTMAEWSKRLGGNTSLVQVRIRQGWTPEQAVSIPNGMRRRDFR